MSGSPIEPTLEHIVLYRVMFMHRKANFNILITVLLLTVITLLTIFYLQHTPAVQHDICHFGLGLSL